MPVGLVHDLAVGIHPCGADAWAQQEYLAAGMSVGAPPDAFNALGQDWGLPPWRPDRLAAVGPRPVPQAAARPLPACRRPAHRPRHGPVPALVDPAGQGAHRRAPTCPVRRRGHAACSAAGGAPRRRPGDRGGPGHRRPRRARDAARARGCWARRCSGSNGRPAAKAAAAAGRWRPDCLATLTTHDLPPTAARLTGEHVALRHASDCSPSPRRTSEPPPEPRRKGGSRCSRARASSPGPPG